MCARGVMLMVTVAGHREKAGALVRWKGAVHKAWAQEGRLYQQKQRSNSLTTTEGAVTTPHTSRYYLRVVMVIVMMVVVVVVDTALTAPPLLCSTPSNLSPP